MNTLTDPLATLRTINATAPFNTWCGIQVDSAAAGTAQISMPWRGEVAQ